MSRTNFHGPEDVHAIGSNVHKKKKYIEKIPKNSKYLAEIVKIFCAAAAQRPVLRKIHFRLARCTYRSTDASCTTLWAYSADDTGDIFLIFSRNRF